MPSVLHIMLSYSISLYNLNCIYRLHVYTVLHIYTKLAIVATYIIRLLYVLLNTGTNVMFLILLSEDEIVFILNLS